MSSPLHQRRGYTLAGRQGGGGGSIFWKKQDIGLASYSVVSLQVMGSFRPREELCQQVRESRYLRNIIVFSHIVEPDPEH
jgi:hypothetical protein